MRGLLTKLPSEALSVAKAYGSCQLFTESVLLALAGGGLGFLLAGALLRTLIGFAPADLPRIADVHLDVRVVILDIRNLCDQQCTVRSAAGISFNAGASC